MLVLFRLIVRQATSNPTKVLDQNRKFNIIVYGVAEQSEGTSRFLRNQNDFKSVSSVVSDIESDSNHSSSIRECRRLGKYVNTKTRPILVTLNSTGDVSNILSHSRRSKPPVSIRPDLSPNDRKINAILLHERWKLIQSGRNRNSIKVRNSTLYVNNQLFGKVTNGTFCPSSTPDDLTSSHVPVDQPLEPPT